MANNTQFNMLDLSNFLDDNLVDMEDQSISTGGDFTRELLPVKGHAVRFISYIEIGVHEKKKFQSEKVDDVDQARLQFEVSSKDGERTDDAGKLVGRRVLTLTVKRSTHAKATLRKLFELMRAGDKSIKHFGQMIGQAFKLNVQWVVKEGSDFKVLATKKQRDDALAAAKAAPDNKDLRVMESWKTIGTPNISAAVNPVFDVDGEDTGEVKQMKVPEMFNAPKFFLWDNPVQEHWNSLFVDGEWENEDKDGKKTVKSKNVVQMAIQAAKNYAGSPPQALVGGEGSLADDLSDTGSKPKKPKKGKKKKSNK